MSLMWNFQPQRKLCTTHDRRIAQTKSISWEWVHICEHLGVAGILWERQASRHWQVTTHFRIVFREFIRLSSYLRILERRRRQASHVNASLTSYNAFQNCFFREFIRLSSYLSTVADRHHLSTRQLDKLQRAEDCQRCELAGAYNTQFAMERCGVYIDNIGYIYRNSKIYSFWVAKIVSKKVWVLLWVLVWVIALLRVMLGII